MYSITFLLVFNCLALSCLEWLAGLIGEGSRNGTHKYWADAVRFQVKLIETHARIGISPCICVQTIHECVEIHVSASFV